MSLKSIRESYSKLLNTLTDAGIKLNESQKNDVDTFVLAIESTMSKQRESAIRKTKKAVTEKLEAEFKELFESVMKNVSENNKLAAKILNISMKLNENKNITEKVSKYLDQYVDTILPKKTIVDYDRLQKLERIQESMKDMLVVDSKAVEEKLKALDESLKSEKSKCETEVAKMQVKLNESAAEVERLTKKLDSLKAVETLESKTKYLPDYEAKAMKKRLAESTTEEIEENFDKELASVRDNAKQLAEETETALDNEIDKIVSEDDIKEDDMLKARPHNGDAAHNGHIPEGEYVDECGDADAAAQDQIDEEDFETMETVKEDDDGNILLDECEVIPADLMQLWCRQSIEVK